MSFPAKSILVNQPGMALLEHVPHPRAHTLQLQWLSLLNLS